MAQCRQCIAAAHRLWCDHATKLLAMQAGGGELAWREKSIQFGKRPSADQGQGTTQSVTDAAQGFKSACRQAYEFRTELEFEKRAIHIEEQRTSIVQQGRWWRAANRGRIGHLDIVAVQE
jgi:hypothetical protein